MKVLKWLFVVLLGILLGASSTCGPREEPSSKKDPKSEKENKDKAPPKKGDNLPVREPILE